MAIIKVQKGTKDILPNDMSIWHFMEEKALEIFELFLKKYPNSELKESVNWLVQNIKNNGKLASELLEKIGNE